jgi:pimeloyl-ACP methyl ester carboxylesterase
VGNRFKKYLIVLLCAVLLFPSLTVKAESETNQQIPNLDLNFDLTIPATIDNGQVADFMEYFSGLLGHDIKLPANDSVTGSVYEAVYGQDNPDNLGDIVNVPELRAKSWDMLRYDYKEAAVYKYVTDNRTVDYTINKYDFEIYERILWAMENEPLNPELVQNAQKAINYIISSEYKIVIASMEDARNQEKFTPTKEGQQRLRQAEVHWGNAMAQLAKGNTRPAMNAFQHANFRAQQVLALHGIEYTVEIMSKDSDGDGLQDIMENYYHTDSNNPDTDGDGLPDLYEIATTNTDPLMKDTDGNSVGDGQEDFDEDQLTNLEEYHAGTNPLEADTDHDGLIDSEELNTSKTMPTKYDTDGDTLGDGREIELGLNPLLQDTDGDGILDKDEQFSQSIPLKPEVKSSFESIGLVPELTIYGVPVEKHRVQIRDAHQIWKQLNHTYGIIGHAVDIETDSPFQSATISFTYNESVLKGTRPEDLKVLWFDEKHLRYVVMPKQALDRTNSKITVETNHFSKYLVVDWSKWTEVFSASFDPGRPTSIRGKINDIILASAYTDRNQGFLNYGTASFGGLENVHSSGVMNGPAAAAQQLKAVSAASLFKEAIDQLSMLDSNKWKALMLPVDGETDISSTDIGSVIEKAQKNHIKVFPVNTGEAANSSLLRKIAGDTYAQAYDMKFDSEANAAAILSGIYEQIKKEEDADSDGIPDSVELRGMRIADGSTVKTSVSLEDQNNDGVPDGRDSDHDGLIDGYEMGYTDRDGNPLPAAKVALMNMSGSTDNSTKAFSALNKEVNMVSVLSYDYEEYMDSYSNPWSEDSDEDGYKDQVDADPQEPYVSPIFLLHGVRSNVGAVFGAYNELAGKDKAPLNKNENSLGEQYSDYKQQELKATDAGSFYTTIENIYGGRNIFLFNYANNGDYYLTASTFNRYLNNLFDVGYIKSPIINGVPEITIIAHSMGGLISRAYIELSKDPNSTVFHDPKVNVKKLITLATPNWGGAMGAYAARALSVASQAIPMLDPNHCIYEGCKKYYDDGELYPSDYYRGLSFKNNINRQDNQTQYYAFIGGAIGDVKKGEKYYKIPAFTWSPQNGSDYEPQARKYATNYIKDYYNDDEMMAELDGSDGWVTINSGLGYKWKAFTKDIEITMNYKLIVFGPGNDDERLPESVDHSPLHHNAKVLELVQAILSLRQ